MSKNKPYKKKPAVIVTIKNKISPLTGREGYLVLARVLRVNKFNCSFFYNQEDAIKAASILNLTMNSLSHEQWRSHFKKEGDNFFPASLIPNEVFNQANELPEPRTRKNDTVGTLEVVAFPEHTLAKNIGDHPNIEDLEVIICLGTRIPKDLIELMKKDNEICRENGWSAMWRQATVERLETRSKIEDDLVEDWVRAGIDRELAEVNVYEATQGLVRQNGGWR